MGWRHPRVFFGTGSRCVAWWHFSRPACPLPPPQPPRPPAPPPTRDFWDQSRRLVPSSTLPPPSRVTRGVRAAFSGSFWGRLSHFQPNLRPPPPKSVTLPPPRVSFQDPTRYPTRVLVNRGAVGLGRGVEGGAGWGGVPRVIFGAVCPISIPFPPPSPRSRLVVQPHACLCDPPRVSMGGVSEFWGGGGGSHSSLLRPFPPLSLHPIHPPPPNPCRCRHPTRVFALPHARCWWHGVVGGGARGGWGRTPHF